ncbi:hypothetical protein POM88_026256 [Heracleum sosnowskyi]|uniref:Uncharacterized protein n=1 Tax=Heracleum sosnowskyi TaxID=360622 RepID=A0AAD8I7S6_9APIA|nr:hypothetical protein POM88_026256 [Heracleum sosnowskyi]
MTNNAEKIKVMIGQMVLKPVLTSEAESTAERRLSGEGLDIENHASRGITRENHASRGITRENAKGGLSVNVRMGTDDDGIDEEADRAVTILSSTDGVVDNRNDDVQGVSDSVNASISKYGE